MDHPAVLVEITSGHRGVPADSKEGVVSSSRAAPGRAPAWVWEVDWEEVIRIASKTTAVEVEVVSARLEAGEEEPAATAAPSTVSRFCFP